jgi:hypothetical protein
LPEDRPVAEEPFVPAVVDAHAPIVADFSLRVKLLL